jgi:hypothetical protein
LSPLFFRSSPHWQTRTAAYAAVRALYRSDERERDSWRKTRLIEIGIAIGNAVRAWKDASRAFPSRLMNPWCGIVRFRLPASSEISTSAGLCWVA